MKRKYQKTLSIPAYREFRRAVKRGDIGGWLVRSGKRFNAGSVKMKQTLKDGWIVEIIARRNYDFRRN